MKKIFALCALIFAIGMIVNFSPGDPSPQPTEQVSTYTEADWYIADVNLIQHLRIEDQAIRYGNQPMVREEDSDSPFYVGNPFSETHRPPPHTARIDKKFDPGRHTQV
jgi:hypothetical protein